MASAARPLNPVAVPSIIGARTQLAVDFIAFTAPAGDHVAAGDDDAAKDDNTAGDDDATGGDNAAECNDDLDADMPHIPQGGGNPARSRATRRRREAMEREGPAATQNTITGLVGAGLAGRADTRGIFTFSDQGSNGAVKRANGNASQDGQNFNDTQATGSEGAWEDVSSDRSRNGSGDGNGDGNGNDGNDQDGAQASNEGGRA